MIVHPVVVVGTALQSSPVFCSVVVIVRHHHIHKQPRVPHGATPVVFSFDVPSPRGAQNMIDRVDVGFEDTPTTTTTTTYAVESPSCVARPTKREATKKKERRRWGTGRPGRRAAVDND